MSVEIDPALKKLKMIKYKCRKELLFFTRYMYKNMYNSKYIVRRHHMIIAEALERVLSGKCKRLIINVPPRYGKTELAVKNFLAYGLGINPAAKFIHLSASSDLALENSEGAQDIIKTEAYKQLFPKVQIKRNSDSKKKWYTTAGGGVYATSAGGQVTGFGAGITDSDKEVALEDEEMTDEELDALLSEIEAKDGFGGAIVIDDPIKPDDTNSDVKRERVNSRWGSTIKSRVNSRNTPVVLIMQRLHPRDMAGYLQEIEAGEWEVISLPALYVDEAGTLQCLDPTKHTIEDLLAMEKNEDEEIRIAYQHQYQQNPKPREGLLLPEQELHYYDPDTVKPELLAEYRFAFIDPADEGGDDLSAPMGYLIGNKIYVVDAIYNKLGTDINEPRCVEFLKNHRCEAAQIESNSAWTLFTSAIKNKMQEDGSDCDIRRIKNTTNKHTRILAQSAFIKNHFVFRKDWATCGIEYRRFFENLTAYRAVQKGTSRNAHDDAPDSLAGMAKYFRSNFPHLWKVITQEG